MLMMSQWKTKMNGCDAKEFISDIASAISHFFTNDGQDAKHHDLIIYSF